MSKKFTEYNLIPQIKAAIAQKGFEYPTQIQEETLSLALEKNVNIVGKAQTGTGKTAAFGLPILNKTDENLKKVQALILCPTRELASQVCDELRTLKGELKIYVSPIYGGQSYEKQNKSLKMGDQIIVGTPGRIIDHLKKKTLKLDDLKHIVFDEADEMMNMGFLEEINQILEFVPDNCTRFLFSATLPKKIQNLIQKYVPQHEFIEVKSENKVTSLSEQKSLEVQEHQKLDALCFIIEQAKFFYGIIFCRTKVEVEKLKENLVKRNYKADCIHGDIPQNRRENVLERFKSQKINILIATDVAARGIDVQNLNYVINYHLPENAESYVHRVGRTGRAGNTGTAITLVSCEEYNQYQQISKINQIEFEVIKPPKANDLRKFYFNNIKEELEKIQAKSRFYEELKDELLEEFEPEELLLKLIQKAYQEISHTEFLPINRNKRSSRGRGGRGGGFRRDRRDSRRSEGRRSESRSSDSRGRDSRRSDRNSGGKRNDRDRRSRRK